MQLSFVNEAPVFLNYMTCKNNKPRTGLKFEQQYISLRLKNYSGGFVYKKLIVKYKYIAASEADSDDLILQYNEIATF
jgi:hypothetical protein